MESKTILTHLKEWQALKHHYDQVSSLHLRELFTQDSERFAQFSVESCGLFLDYSRNRITQTTQKLLIDLAQAVNLQDKIEAIFRGDAINTTERRSVLHSALRNQTAKSIVVKGQNIVPTIKAFRANLREFVDQVLSGQKLGATGKPIRYVVNVGIGGSHLGPMMSTYALKAYSKSKIKFYFISSVDKQGIDDIFEQIDPETALFIISSKTFTTIETLTNAKTISKWMQARYGSQVLKTQFVAVTSASDKAQAFGIPEENIFPLWDWVGGRYSIWSAIGLPLMLLLGNEGFDDFLLGAFEMDRHFSHAPFEKNMPIILALLSIWYTNFFGSNVQAIIPYAHRLRYLISYLQQMEMESNGKSRNLNGEQISYSTGPVIFGEEGCNGQHAYHQLLLQGNHLIPVDFILVGKGERFTDDEHHDILIASGLSQAQALMRGKTYEEAYQELLHLNYSEQDAKQIASHRVIPGNRPSNIIFMQQLTPKNLGALIALYEHKIFVQGVIWNINSFDQWGVELGKQLLPNILQQLQGQNKTTLDNATDHLIKRMCHKVENV